MKGSTPLRSLQGVKIAPNAKIIAMLPIFVHRLGNVQPQYFFGTRECTNKQKECPSKVISLENLAITILITVSSLQTLISKMRFFTVCVRLAIIGAYSVNIKNFEQG